MIDLSQDMDELHILCPGMQDKSAVIKVRDKHGIVIHVVCTEGGSDISGFVQEKEKLEILLNRVERWLPNTSGLQCAAVHFDVVAIFPGNGISGQPVLKIGAVAGMVKYLNLASHFGNASLTYDCPDHHALIGLNSNL